MNITAAARVARAFSVIVAISLGWTGFANPTFTSQTWDLTVNVGDSATFSVTATGNGPIAYQWRKDGTDIPGATNSSYTIASAQSSDAAGYYCQATDNDGPNWSGTAKLTVNDPGQAPAVTAQTWDQTVAAGNPVTFSITATGTAPLQYQWRKDGTDIPGANSPSYTINSVQQSDAGGYYCFVTNSYGSAWSGSANLTVTAAGQAPAVTAQTWDQTVVAGNPVTFSITASGTAPLQYQWRKDGTDIPGANSPSYTINSVQQSDAGGYYCFVTNSYGSAWSGSAVLTVTAAGQAPSVTSQTWDQTVAAGNPVTFSITASGTAPLQYQWRKDGTDIPGANSPSYTINSVQQSDAGGYYCFVTNSYGSAWSGNANLTVTAARQAPVITTNPQSQTVASGTSVTFSVAATGTAPLSYQWRKNGGNITGATNSTYTITSAQAADAGNYDVLVSNSSGSATSTVATLTITDGPPVITVDPADVTVAAGNPASFSVTASGAAPLAYQWRRGGTNIPNATTATLNLPNVQAGDNGTTYDVVVSNSSGTATSRSATLTVTTPSGTLMLLEQPRSQTVTAGHKVAFSVKATGTGTLRYQWRQGKNDLPGATGPLLIVDNADPTKAGTYYVIVSDDNGSQISVPANLTFENPPPTGTQPSIIEVHTAGPGVLVVVLQSPVVFQKEGALESYDALDLTPGSWTINGSPTADSYGPYRYSIPWDESPKQIEIINGNSVNEWPVTTRHHIYLNLGTPFVNGTTYNIATPYGAATFVYHDDQTYCESIKVNQVGYSLLNGNRHAVFGLYMGQGSTQDPGTRTFPNLAYQVIDETNGQSVASGTLNDGNIIDKNDDSGTGITNSGEHVYWLNLAGVGAGGPYYVLVPGAGRSRSFGINNDYSRYIAYTTVRGLFHQRCGMPLAQSFTRWTHAGCHDQIALYLRSPYPQDEVYVPDGPGPQTPYPVSGGYHDAGDMDHTLPHPNISILMLSFYEAFPSLFRDNQYNIPESGNGIPDFLDEVMWGVRLWENLQIKDAPVADYEDVKGAVMSGWSTGGPRLPDGNHATVTTEYGVHDAANDPFQYGTMVETEQTTAYVAGLFAHASRILRGLNQTDKANELLDRARLAWGYLDRKFGASNAQNASNIKSCYLYASLQLWLAVDPASTEAATYRDKFMWVANELLLLNHGTWPEAWNPGNSDPVCRTAYFISYLLAHPNDTTGLAADLRDKVLLAACANGTQYSPDPDNLPYAHGVGGGDMTWGNATAQGRYADIWMYGTLFAKTDDDRKKYINRVAEYADFSLGLNPMNMSYYTGLGTDQPISPCHCNSYFTKFGVSDGKTSDTYRDEAGNPIGNVPGILVYGPTRDKNLNPYEAAVSNKLYPEWDKLPGQRHYANGWSLIHNNEFTTHETIVWNAIMNAFLAR